MNTSHEQTGALGPEAPQAPGTAQPVPPLAGATGYVPPLPGSIPGAPNAWASRYGKDPRFKSPALTGVLSIMPGLGHVYLGYTQRGFVHMIIYAATIAILASGNARHMEPLFGMFLGFFWFYNMIDAVRRASLINQALLGMGPAPAPMEIQLPKSGGSIFGGVILIAVGIIFLGRTRFDMNLDWLADWWPGILVLFGGYLVWKAIRTRT